MRRSPVIINDTKKCDCVSQCNFQNSSILYFNHMLLRTIINHHFSGTVSLFQNSKFIIIFLAPNQSYPSLYVGPTPLLMKFISNEDTFVQLLMNNQIEITLYKMYKCWSFGEYLGTNR